MKMLSTSIFLLVVTIIFAAALVYISMEDGFRASRADVKGELVATVAKPKPPSLLPELNAYAYLVKTIGEEEPLMARREKEELPPASITKLLTALVAKEVIPKEHIIRMSEEAKATEEKMSEVGVGEGIRRDDMIKLALIQSANDAARALAEEIGRRFAGETFEEQLLIFSALANEKARIIAMEESRFENPTGLDGTYHRSSAEDLVHLAQYLWQYHPELWEMTRLLETDIMTADSRSIHIENSNVLLKEYPAILGGKTGFTDNAKETFMFLYPLRSGKVAAAVLLGSDDRFEDGREIIQWLESINQ